MTPLPDQWYAVYTQARMEKWARSNLWERGFKVYLPLYHKERRHARKTDWVSAPLFPRYLFVAADPQSRQQRSINNQNTLVPGEQVRLQSGAMADHIGLFERRGEGERVIILLNLLGREVRVKVPASTIARVL
jgi:transcriptional antiterminator RfaH